ncbi:hypothetical protein ALO82_200166 [Pseudomonas syringae pv. broussonetiae]|uniref:Uncharacterized protein n=1 Tax=Pseudomonas savastanoi TaxID=29438 RepID=A0A3M5JQH2_PSESS|nr:hypothetical protein ALO82_200166 [Pseudomonas syringae pv. broussonetiae]RMS31403.1 hypothetical protein ALP70_200028 [Pseudomonas savastanoi]RMT25539.1 hypothetical protein ALP51_200060 [Pseudomonas savastanoi]
MRSHLRLIVSVILPVIPLDHVVARHLVWIGHLEHILTSAMVDATSRIKHLVYELVITNQVKETPRRGAANIPGSINAASSTRPSA